MKICPVGPRSMWKNGRAGGGQTDMTKLIVAFHNFSETPNNTVISYKVLYKTCTNFEAKKGREFLSYGH